VGTCYFKKHLAAFVSVYGHETPTHLYNSIDHSLQTQQKHEIWLQKIRKVVGERITNEEERVPSFTSLWRHWLRSCWVSQMWQNSPCHDLYSSIPLPEHSGWIHHSDGTYAIDWEAPEIQEKIKDTIDFLTKGCSCKKGCKSKNCGCQKKSSYCGPGCECQGCVNLPVEQHANEEESADEDNGDSSGLASDSSDESSDELQMEIITEEFLFIPDSYSFCSHERGGGYKRGRRESATHGKSPKM